MSGICQIFDSYDDVDDDNDDVDSDGVDGDAHDITKLMKMMMEDTITANEWWDTTSFDYIHCGCSSGALD